MFFRKTKAEKPEKICELAGEPAVQIHARSAPRIYVGRVTGIYLHNGFIIFTSPKGGACVKESEFVSFEFVARA